jgi:hypothetical protein
MPKTSTFHEDDHHRQRRRRARHPAGLAARLLGRGEPLSRPDGRDAGRDRRAAGPGGGRAGDHAGRSTAPASRTARSPIRTSSTPSRPAPMRKASTSQRQDDGPRPKPTSPAPAHRRATRRRGLRHRLAGHHRRPLRPLGSGLFRPGSGALGRAARRGAYDAWRQYATHDLTPEIAGLKGSRNSSAKRPTPPTRPGAGDDDARPAGGGAGTYLHKLLFRWAAGRRWAATTCGRRSLRAARMTR